MIYKIKDSDSALRLTSNRIDHQSVQEMLQTAIRNSLEVLEDPTDEMRFYQFDQAYSPTWKEWQEAMDEEKEAKLESMIRQTAESLMICPQVQEFLYRNSETKLEPVNEKEEEMLMTLGSALHGMLTQGELDWIGELHR